MPRYSAAAIQTDLENPANRRGMARNTRRILELIDFAVEGYKPFVPIRLVVFPEFAHSAPVYPTLSELRRKLGVEIPNEHTEKLVSKASEFGIFIQSGTMLEVDSKYSSALFNTTCLIGPGGIVSKYRKVYPWIPWEVHTSPHDIPDYEEELFPVADTEIGKLGVAICYDWIFPESLRQLALNGAEVLIRVSAYMDPFGTTEPTDWWTVVNRCRALENVAYVVASNQGARLRRYPPFSWPGGSMIVDFDGRIVSQATPGDGEKIVVGVMDIGALRSERKQRQAHNMLAHLRCEAHPVYKRGIYPGGQFDGNNEWTYDHNLEGIEKVKKELKLGSRKLSES